MAETNGERVARSRLDNVTLGELSNFDPSRYDARPNGDGTYQLIPVLWWDDASYAAYQGDPHGDYDD